MGQVVELLHITWPDVFHIISADSTQHEQNEHSAPEPDRSGGPAHKHSLVWCVWLLHSLLDDCSLLLAEHYEFPGYQAKTQNYCLLWKSDSAVQF